MTSRSPYLMRAIHDWILDNGLTPYVLIDATQPNVDVPWDYVEDGRIILNISPSAANQFLIDNDGLSFDARFAGKPSAVFAPISAVKAIYAAENGEGMGFDALPAAEAAESQEVDSEVESSEPDSNPDPEPPKPPAGKRPALRVVK
ncbi:MAG: ClpXP protease specificity-enhancing factor [Proteobacteria bacterium]|nr:MAG: ClpXP protease specificity-enhancing factor [Pseudomonadota bacterium]